MPRQHIAQASYVHSHQQVLQHLNAFSQHVQTHACMPSDCGFHSVPSVLSAALLLTAYACQNLSWHSCWRCYAVGVETCNAVMGSSAHSAVMGSSAHMVQACCHCYITVNTRGSNDNDGDEVAAKQPRRFTESGSGSSSR